jgi:hypothetical protein
MAAVNYWLIWITKAIARLIKDLIFKQAEGASDV